MRYRVLQKVLIDRTRYKMLEDKFGPIRRRLEDIFDGHNELY